MGVCILNAYQLQDTYYGYFKDMYGYILCKNKVYGLFVFTLNIFGLISLRNKVGPVGDRHVKSTLHVIFMLHIHI